VPFAKDFLRSADGFPPLARLLQGGRGGKARLKLFLTITMMATRKPYDISRPPSPAYWARMLGVTGEPPARRVADALHWLDREGFIRLTPRKGTLPLITLLTPQSPGRPGLDYERPIERGERWIGLPLTLWTKGWIIDLPATSLALIMVVRDVQQGRDAARYVPGDERTMYGLSAAPGPALAAIWNAGNCWKSNAYRKAASSTIDGCATCTGSAWNNSRCVR
jgi:hypothetical protein